MWPEIGITLKKEYKIYELIRSGIYNASSSVIVGGMKVQTFPAVDVIATQQFLPLNNTRFESEELAEEYLETLIRTSRESYSNREFVILKNYCI